MSTRGRRTALRLTLTHDDWQALHAAQQLAQHSLETPLCRRARIVLLCAQGQSIAAIAQAVGLSRTHTYKWLRRWQEAGWAGLQTRRGGRPRGASKWHDEKESL